MAIGEIGEKTYFSRAPLPLGIKPCLLFMAQKGNVFWFATNPVSEVL